MAEFRPFNYAQAVQSGQQVAMNALKLREGVRGIQGTNLLSDLSAQGLTGFQKYNALQQAGHGDLAQQEQARDLEVSTLKSNYAKSQLERVGSYDTFMKMADSLDAQGVATRQQTMDRFGVTDDPASWDGAKPTIDTFLGREADVAKAPTTRTVKRGDRFITEEWSNERWEEVGDAPRRTEVVSATPEQWGLTKGAATDAQKKMGGALGFRDQLSNLYKFSKKHENLHDVGSYLTQLYSNYAEKVGITPPESFRKEASNWHELNNRTRTVVDAIRSETTKSAASFKELDQFLKPRTPQSDDSLTKFNAKMKGLLEYDESITIRTKLLLERGFTFGGRTGTGEDSQVLYSDANGNLIPIEQIMPLSAIPTHSERRAEIMRELAEGRRVKDFTPDDMKSLKLRTIRQLRDEGYNTVIYGQ